MTRAHTTPTSVMAKPFSAFAAKLSSFAPLSESDLAVIAYLTKSVRNVNAHMSLLRPDDECHGTLVVLSGLAWSYRQRADGKRQNLSYLLPGDTFGLARLKSDGLGALSACTVALIGDDVLQAALEKSSQLADGIRIAGLVSEAILREWIVNLGSRSAIERIAHLFCELFTRLEAVSLVSGDSFAFPVNQAEVGATVGLSCVHVNRSLQQLRRAGFIELKSRVLHVKNRAELAALSGFNSDYLFP